MQVVKGDGGVVQEKENAREEKAPDSAPQNDAAPAPNGVKGAAILAPTFFALTQGLRGACLGAILYDDEDQPTAPNADAPAQDAPAPNAPAPNADAQPDVEQSAPGVYVVVNPDGSLMLSSSDEAALEEFQQKLAAVVDELKSRDAQDASNNDAARDDAAQDDLSNPASPQYLSYMTEENLAKAKERILLESRQYTVYKVENVGVAQLVPRLQTYLADRINANTQRGAGNYYSSSGIYVRSISTQTPLTFQPDVALNTIMVYGSKADRDAVSAMIVLLDDVDLFPQPITKPYKIKVENTSPARMAQQVLSAFQRKFQTTLMPGNLSPRIMPNPATNSLEVYAPEQLAKEIEEYVKEVDKEILEESVRKVRVVELKTINSKALASYLQSLRTQQTTTPSMFSTPYIGGAQSMFNPAMGNMMNAAAARARYQALQAPGGMGMPAVPPASRGF